MLSISAKINPHQLAEASRLLAGIKNGAERAGTRAINKVARSTRGQVVRQIASQTGLKQKDVRARIVKLTLATFKAMFARLTLLGRPIRLADYGTVRQTKKGVRHKAKGVENPLPEAFVATMRTGHKGVFRRRAVGGGSGLLKSAWRVASGRTAMRTVRRLRAAAARGLKRVPRLPIDEQYGPNPLLAVDANTIQVGVNRDLDRELATQVRVLLEQEAAKAAAQVTRA